MTNPQVARAERPRSISKKHLDDLRSSGLNDESIRLARVYTETDPAAVGALLGWGGPARSLGACLVLPFFDPDGQRLTHYTRVKPDKPFTDDRGRPAKYLSPKDKPNEPYLPPRAREALRDATVSLIITEGEKKALAADQAGYAAVGLVGAWGWQKRRESDDGPRELLPLLDAFNWRNREVRIALDSDALYKPDVQRAEWELALVLTRLGARVTSVRLPGRLGGPKVGLDDFLLARGTESLDELLRQSAPACRPRFWFTNVAERMNPEDQAKPVLVPRAVGDIAAELVGRSGGWPRCVSNSLVVPDAAGGVRPVTTHHELAAFAARVFDTGGTSGVRWSKLPGAVSPPVLFAYLTAECERFDRADRLPHVPRLPGVLYTCPDPSNGTGETLNDFLAFFSPATQVDRALLRACLMTLLWGGPPGKRPAFLFEGDESDPQAGRGVGKSTVAQKLASVFGGSIAYEQNEKFDGFVTRVLSRGASAFRVLLLDNVKTFRLSSADLESLITAPDINGHRMYDGQGAVPNYFTMLLTLNGAALSKDVAQRVVPIRLSRAGLRAGWESEVEAFIRNRRDELIADLAAALRAPPARLDRLTRWGVWESEVLARVPNPDACMAAIAERTGEMDADSEDADRIRDTLADVLREFSKTASRERVLINSPALVHLIQLALNERNITANGASTMVKALAPRGFTKSRRGIGRFWLWMGDEVRGRGRETLPVLHWDADGDKWQLREPRAGDVPDE